MASLLARRAGSRKLLLLALVLLTAAATALVALTVAGAGVTATRASRAAIDAHLGGAPAWEVRTRIAPDPDAQDRAVRETVVETATGLTTEVGRYLLTEPTTVLADGGESRRGLLSTDAGSLLVDGRWPRTGEVLAPADLGVGIGGTVRVGDATFTVSGTWDRPEPTLSGTPAPTGDPDPLVLADDAAVLAIDDASFVFWNVRVDPTGLDLAALTDLATVGTRLDTSIRAADGVAIRGLSVADNLETGGGQLATVLQGSTTTVRAVSLAPAGFLVAVAALAIAQFLQLLALTRDAETRVLLARGAGRARIVRSAALESAAVAVVGAGAGALISLAVLSGAPGGPQQTPAVVTTAVGTLVWTVGAAVLGALTSGDGQSLRAGRVRRAAGGGVLVVVGALALLAGARLLELGTVVTETSDGVRADPLAVLAIGAALLLGGGLVLALLAPATRAVEAAAARTRGLGLPLAARQTARRLPHLATLALLVSLAAAAVTVASAFAGTTHNQRWADARLAAGSDVRLTLPGPLNAGTGRTTTPDVVPFAALPEVGAAAAVLTAQAPITNGIAIVVAAPTGRLEGLASDGVMGSLGGTDLDALVRLPGQGEIPEGAERLEARVPVTLAELEGHEDPEYTLEFEVSGTARLATEDGGILSIPLAAQSATFGRDEVAVTAEIPLPEAAARVLGIEVRLEGVTPARDNDQVLAERGIYWVHPETGVVDDEGYHEAFMELALDGIPDTTSSFTLTLGQIEALADGTPVTPDGLKLPEDAEISVQEDGTTWVPGYFGPYGRSDFTLRFLADEAAAAPVPAFVSQELAAALDLSEGSSLGLALDGPTVNTRVAGVVEAVPGSTDAMAVLVDLPSLTAHLVATRTAVNGPNEIWLSTDGDLEEVGAAALTLAEEQGLEGVTAALARPAGTDATAPIRATFWLAAAGALALALVGAGAAAVGQGHGRDGELAVLRALGRSARRTAGARVGELLAIALPSLVLGVLLGWAVSALFIPFLSRTATAGNVPAQLTLHVPGLLAALAALLVGLVAIATMVALAVRQRMSRVGVES